MKKYLYTAITALFFFWHLPVIAGQQAECLPSDDQPTQGEVLLNYGSVSNATSFRGSGNVVVGQPVVGISTGTTGIMQTGYWSRWLLPPAEPILTASQGEFPNRVQLNWDIDPLSPAAVEGFIIRRDGVFLTELSSDKRQFIDFNVQAGEYYEYTVNGKNQFGAGAARTRVGFVNPNGLVSGKIETESGNAVANAIVTLEPTFGNSLEFDGLSDHVCISHSAAFPTDMFTLSFWIKIGDSYDHSGIIDNGSEILKNFWVTTTDSLSAKGIVAAVGDGTQQYELTHEFEENPDDWQHVAIAYAAGNLLLYINGEFTDSRMAHMESEDNLLRFGSSVNDSDYFKGHLDDVRLFDRPLTGTEIKTTKNISIPKNMDGLVAYWKFDEGVGESVFDLTDNKLHADLFGPSFSDDTPDIVNAGTTDLGGFYSIPGINYSQTGEFTSKPSKSFYANQALEFNAAFDTYADLTEVPLTDTSTIEITVYPYDTERRQSILSWDGNLFELFTEDGDYKLTIDGQTEELGPAEREFQHLSIGLDGGTGSVVFFRNGDHEKDLSYSNFSFASGSGIWKLGAGGGTGTGDFFTGLVDDVAFFDTLLSEVAIQQHAAPIMSGGVDAGDGNLISYFPLNEGLGTEIADIGPAMTGKGELHGATFSILAYRQEESPHEFRPAQRSVNINHSNTAATGIDFVSESTVTITGVVRFENTFCYQDSAEILVNGNSAVPPIYTDSDGRFVGDFEPGSTVTLSPRFDDHVFFPALFEVRNISRPVSGVLFQNQTKRTIEGQMAGNEDCRLSVIPSGAIVKVRVESLNGCLSKELQLEEANGKFTFSDLPPIPFSVAVTQHSNNTIYEYFQLQGGKEVDLRYKKRDTIDFIYISPPKVWIESFPENGCPGDGLKMIQQSTPQNNYREYDLDIRVFEEYDGGNCYLDSFVLVIENDIGDQSPVEVVVTDTTTYNFEFWAGMPRIFEPYTKFLQVTAEVGGSQATEIEEVVVLGERSRESSFITATPELPLLILRDPPGDGSFASVSEGTTFCNSWSNAQFTDLTTGSSIGVDIGAAITTYAGSPFGGVIFETEIISESEFSVEITEVETTTNMVEVCITNEVEYATSSGSDVFYENADLYVGAAINFEFSATDVLSFNPDTLVCDFELGQNVRVWPEGFGTKYIFSDWQIQTDVIPDLEFTGDTVSANAWRNILNYNQELKDAAIFRENISFDALTTFTETFKSTQTSTQTFETEFTWTEEMSQALGISVGGIGSTVSFSYEIGRGVIETTQEEEIEERVVSYTLADSDVNDNFTIDILDDPIYGTPVFKLRSGESKCPWEPGTLNREEVGFAIDRFTAVNVPTNGTAVFNLTLSNLGQTGKDDLVYIVGLKDGSNPDGAIISLDGVPLAGNPRPFQLRPFESINVLLTIERGPVAFSYNDIGIFMASQCQWEHSLSLGYNLAGYYDEPDKEFQAMYRTEDLLKFYREFKLNVEFIEPCSPVDIGFPMQDWVITPDDQEQMFITLNNYLAGDPQLELIRVQYRRTGGDGAWINIAEIHDSILINYPVFYNVLWDLSELSDGPYEIRAITQCFDVSLDAGISRVIQGRKETEPPELFGTPQPSDGVLNRGEEISISFTKRINCDRVFQADGIGSDININNIALQDMTMGGQLVDAIIACKDDKIVVTPNIPLQFIENHTLRATANEIEDLYGNATDLIEWEFVMNNAALYWEGDDIVEVVEEGNELSVTRMIRNQGGQTTNFNLTDIPEWLQVIPRQGSVDPGRTQIVEFRFPASLSGGFYFNTIVMETIDGDKPLDIDLRVICEPPDWNINPANFSFSMNLTLELNIEGELSTDQLDHVGAFVDGELKGVGYVQYNAEIDKHLVFLTVYSNNTSGETITFRVWDADACLLYGPTVESFEFIADETLGHPNNPVTIHTQNLLIRQVYFNPGWNWFSYNLDIPHPEIDSALASISHPEDGLIKSQTAFSTYSTSAGSWIGNLNELTHLTMYQYNSAVTDSLLVVGMGVDPSTPIDIFEGWNWIGYLPQRSLPLNAAMSSLNPLDGDVIKSQQNFAQFVPTIGWIGNLDFMSPLNGYLLRTGNPGTLVYPNIFDFDAPLTSSRSIAGSADLFDPSFVSEIHEETSPFEHWEVNPRDYEFSMNAIAVVVDDMDRNLLNDGDEVAAFYNGEVRGSGTAKYVEAFDKFMLFLTVYSNTDGEMMHFRYFDSDSEEVYDLAETLYFSTNKLVGEVTQPFEFNLSPVSTEELEELTGTSVLSIHPNPTRGKVYINYFSNIHENVVISVRDSRGMRIDLLEKEVNPGQNTFEWDGGISLPAGLFYLSLKSEQGTQSRKLIINR